MWPLLEVIRYAICSCQLRWLCWSIASTPIKQLQNTNCITANRGRRRMSGSAAPIRGYILYRLSENFHYLGFSDPTISLGEQRLILFNAGYIGHEAKNFAEWMLCGNHRRKFSVGQDPRKKQCCRWQVHPEKKATTFGKTTVKKKHGFLSFEEAEAYFKVNRLVTNVACLSISVCMCPQLFALLIYQLNTFPWSLAVGPGLGPTPKCVPMSKHGYHISSNKRVGRMPTWSAFIGRNPVWFFHLPLLPDARDCRQCCQAEQVQNPTVFLPINAWAEC